MPGNYVVEIQRCKTGKTRKDVPFFVAECMVLECDELAKANDRNVGNEMSYMITMDKDPALGNVADFMRMGLWIKALEQDALNQLPTSHGDKPRNAGEIDIDNDLAEMICGEENPLAGLRMGLHAFNKMTLAGRDFTRTKWTSVAEARAKINASL